MLKERRRGRCRSPRCLRVMFFDAVLYEPIPVQVNMVWKSLPDTFSMVRTAVDLVVFLLFSMTLAKKEKNHSHCPRTCGFTPTTLTRSLLKPTFLFFCNLLIGALTVSICLDWPSSDLPAGATLSKHVHSTDD